MATLAQHTHLPSPPSTQSTVVSNQSHILRYDPSQPSVDYDTNVTPLYAAIGKSDWDEATRICEGILRELSNNNNGNNGNNNSSSGDSNELPRNSDGTITNQAATWVTRHSPTGSTLWRFLPLHSTCALSPPHTFLRLLIKLYPPSVRTLDHSSLLPLHYACGAQCSREVIYTLLMSYPAGALIADGRGMMGLHYLAQWGPRGGSSGIVEMLCVATGEMGNAKDKDGNTPLKLAQNASYPNHNEVAKQIASHVMKRGLHLTNSIGGVSHGVGVSHGGGVSHSVGSPANKYLTSPINKGNNLGKQPYPSFDDQTIESRKSHNIPLPSFGDLLEDEEREEGQVVGGENGNGVRSGRDGGEVRESIEISLGDGNVRSNNVLWNKLGISPVNNPKSKLQQHMTNNHDIVKSSSDNRSILSDPITGNNQRGPISPPRRIDQVQHSQQGGGGANDRNESMYTDPTPKTGHRRTFSWDVEKTADGGGAQQENGVHVSSSTNDLINKYSSPRHRQGIPPMSPRFKLSNNNNNSNTPKNSDVPSNHYDLEQHQSNSITKEEYTSLKLSKEQTESQLRILKLEKDQLELQLKSSQDEKSITNRGQEMLEKEKQQLQQRAEALTQELNSSKQRVVELENKLTEVETFGKNAAETFGIESARHKEKVEALEQELKTLREKVQKNDEAQAQLDQEKKRNALLEAQVKELETKIDAMQRTNGESVYTHLQEVRSLRSSLEKATVEIEKNKARSVEVDEKERVHRDEMAKKQREWEEERLKLLGEIEATRRAAQEKQGELKPSSSSDWIEERVNLLSQMEEVKRAHRQELLAKENEWKEQRATLESKLDNSSPSDQWQQERSKLEAQVRSLTEASWTAQNAEYAAKAELSRIKLQWDQERSKLQSELNSRSDGQSVSSVGIRSNVMKENEELRKFHSIIRKEHEETVAQLEKELEVERDSKKDLLSQIVTLQCKVSTLEGDLEEAGASWKYHSGASVDSQSEVLARKAIDAVRKEAEGREQSLRKQLEQTRRHIKHLEDELYDKSYVKSYGSGSATDYSSRELGEARDLICHLEEREQGHEKEVEKLSATLKEMEMKDTHQREEINQLKSKIDKLEETERGLRKELDKDAPDDDLYQHKLRSIKNELSEVQRKEDGYLREIRDLKKQISELESQNDSGLEAKLWEAQRAHEWALNEKDDELTSKIRDIRKEYENTIIDNQNQHLKELRDAKRELQSAFRLKEDSYMQQLRDAKKREQALQDREDDLVKQMADLQMRSSLDDFDIDGILRKKDDEFARLLEESSAEKSSKIADLSAKIERLEQELEHMEEAGVVKRELSDCKKEFERQRRKHKSEVNKLQNTLELQKSKETRLQSQIKSLETQIADMVSDYEARLEEAYYATCEKKTSLH